VIVNLNAQYQTFLADIGVDDEVGNAGSVVFQVFLDDLKVFDSGLMTGASATRSISVDVTGHNKMQLIVTDGGTNGIDSDHADWANARLTAAAAAAALDTSVMKKSLTTTTLTATTTTVKTTTPVVTPPPASTTTKKKETPAPVKTVTVPPPAPKKPAPAPKKKK
jgi:hypothetical protein